MNKLIYSVILAIPLLLSGALAYGQSDNVSVFVIGSGKTSGLDLKTIEGESSKRNFVIKPESVIQVRQGNNLVVFTQPNNVVES